MSISEVLPQYLFGLYVIEIHKFFTEHFASFRWSQTATPLTLQVVYGTPRAAFRYQQQTYNGKIILPMLNFFESEQIRDKTRERFVKMWDPDSYDPVDSTVAITRNPAHYNVTYSFNLWTNSNRERDIIVHEMMQCFPVGEMSLVYFPDITEKKNYLLMPLTLSESISNETNIEGLDMKETRDAIKTTWTISTHTIVPYNVYRVPVYKNFYVASNMQVYNGADIVDIVVDKEVAGELDG